MTAVTPIKMPKIAKPERSLWSNKLFRPSRRVCQNFELKRLPLLVADGPLGAPRRSLALPDHVGELRTRAQVKVRGGRRLASVGASGGHAPPRQPPLWRR